MNRELYINLDLFETRPWKEDILLVFIIISTLQILKQKSVIYPKTVSVFEPETLCSQALT